MINYEDNYVQPLVLAALRKCLPKDSYTLINDITELPNLTDNFVQIGEYESIPFEHILAHGTSSLANTYIIRKALTRKHYLSNTVHNWVTKKSNSILKHHVKTSCHFELDYAEFLEDAIIDAWDLLESFSRNAGKARNHREWWILKPGMSERGHGIRLFSSLEELQTVFEEWETEESSLDEIEKEENNESLTSHFSLNLEKDSINNVVTSDLRHFIVQPYIHPPYLIQNNPQKFHIRTYVLAMGSLKVYVYHDMLALFSQALYVPPWNESKDLSAHLTNTCLGRDNKEELVRLFWSLQIPEVLKKRAFAQICEITGEIFEAAARGMTVHFQTIPNVFEVFGLDFLLDETGKAWLLEINAFPDFQQTGEALREVVGEFWEAVVAHTIGMFFGYCQNIQNHISCSKMVLVNELKLHGGLNGS